MTQVSCADDRLASMASGAAARSSWSLYGELAKVRLVVLVLVTTAVGFVLASPAALDGLRLAWTILGTALAAGGANAINQCVEVRRDARMERTRRRPLPSGRLNPRRAWTCAVGLSVAGPLLLAGSTNGLTALLALMASGVYIFLYTPLKLRSSLSTLVGAVCGALPPMLGWTAAAGRLDAGAWILGATLFVWQIPHFLALAWLYRSDYARGGFRMLPVVDPSGDVTFRVIVLYSLALVPLGLAAALAGLAGGVFAVGSVVLGGVFLTLGVRLYRRRTEAHAQRLFLASVIHLPLLLGLMVADRGPVL